MASPTMYPATAGEWSGDSSPASSSDQKLLERIRSRFDHMVQAWREIRDDAENDMRALSPSGPWLDEDRSEREKYGRPCIHLDQLGQYVHSLVNEVRSSPIAINVEPAGEGSNEDTAELRANRIRQIEYESNAVQAYQTALECAARHSYGAFGISLDYKSWDSRERVIRVRRFVNSDAILWDPAAKEADSSDMQDAFVIDRVLRDDFERQYPDASVTSFGEEEVRLAPSWFDDSSVQVAEYWYIERKRRKCYWVSNEREAERRIFADAVDKLEEIPGDRVAVTLQGLEVIYDVIEKRTVEQPLVKMVLTNGIEILDRTDWPGKWIPVVPVLGEERYVRSGGKTRRRIHSYIRMAIDGQKLFDYYKSAEAEVVGQSPKMPYLGYEGQFETETDWENINKVPKAYAEVKATTEEVPGAVLPLPQRNVFEPPVQALEIGAESARRSIQAAVGSYGVTRLDDTNVKSGIALKQLKSQNDLGSYHFIDNYKVSLRHAGRIINDLLDDVEGDDPHPAGIRKANEEHEVVQIGTPIQGEDGQVKVNRYRLTDEAQHEVTISTGPTFQSQREEATSVSDLIIANLATLPIDPAAKAKLLAQAIRLKQVGPIGDEMADIVDPKDPNANAPAQIAALTQQLQALDAFAKEMQMQNQQLQSVLQAKMLDIRSKEKIAEQDNETKLITAWLQTKSQEAIVALKEEIAAIRHEHDLQEAARSQAEDIGAQERLQQSQTEQAAQESVESSE